MGSLLSEGPLNLNRHKQLTDFDTRFGCIDEWEPAVHCTSCHYICNPHFTLSKDQISAIGLLKELKLQSYMVECLNELGKAGVLELFILWRLAKVETALTILECFPMSLKC
jgi:hypothetical protein